MTDETANATLTMVPDSEIETNPAMSELNDDLPDSPARRRYQRLTDNEKRALLTSYDGMAGALERKEFAQEHQLSAATICRWRKQFGMASLRAKTPRAPRAAKRSGPRASPAQPKPRVDMPTLSPVPAIGLTEFETYACDVINRVLEQLAPSSRANVVRSLAHRYA